MPYDIEKHYLQYLLDPKRIRDVANNLFHEHCYDLVRKKSDKEYKNLDLFGHARYIRNHITHRSRSSETKLISTASYFVKKGYDCSAGELLARSVKREMQFGKYFVRKDVSYFNAYCLFFAVLANDIAPI